MYITIGSTDYTELRNVSFSPEISAAATSLPVGEFQADILTEDEIVPGEYATMVGTGDLHFCRYWIIYAERIAPGIVRIRAQSRITLLDRRTLPAVMYDKDSDYLYTILQGIFTDIRTEVTFPISYPLTPFGGFFPEQTARERLLWFCLIAQAYVRTYGDTDPEAERRDLIEIGPIDETPVLVSEDVTFWRPSVTYTDHVTAVKVWAYSYDERTPQSGEQSVTDGTTTWVVNKQAHTLTNPNVPVTAPDNVVEVDISAVTEDIVDDVLSHLAKYYFPRMGVEFDCINNGEFWPGDKLQVSDGLGNMLTGYAERMDFRFGVQSRSSVRLTACDNAAAATLTILYQWDGATLARRTYHLPVGYEYEIQNPYLDFSAGRYRYVFRPVNEYATGTISAGSNTNTQPMALALRLDQKTGILDVISVDAVEVQTIGGYDVGVIS